jgi:tyrosyl-tRNA synthetase
MFMDLKERMALVTRNTQEVVSLKELEDLLKKKKQPSVYLGTAITGRPHIGYFVWVLKMADFIKAGFKVKLLLADMHGALDGTPWNVLEKRYKYYHAIIPLMFEAVGADLSKLELVKGSSYQKNSEYSYDILKMSTLVSIHDCLKASSEVVKHGDNPKLAGLIYPIMQAIDEEHLDVDMQYGGVDQRKIFMFARENNPKLGYKSRVEVMTPLLPGLTGEKMSASVKKSKIDVLDDATTVKKKMKGAHCEEGIVEGNGVLAFLKHVIMVIKQDKGENFIIERPEKFGGNLEFSSYEEVEKLYVAKKLHPLDLKNGIAKEISSLLGTIEKKRKKLEKISSDAYQ